MENRLNLLCETGVIDRDICDGMLLAVKRMDEEWGLPVRTEQGIMAITHMANALMRSRRGETVAPLDEDIQHELSQSPYWPVIFQSHHSLLKMFSVTLHADEEGYLLANLYGLWMAAHEGG